MKNIRDLQIQVDLLYGALPVSRNLKQGDTTRLTLTVFRGGKSYPLESLTPILNAKRADKLIYIQTSDYDVNDNSITYNLAPQIVAEPGRLQLEIELDDADGNIISSFTIGIIVEPRLFNGEEDVAPDDQNEIIDAAREAALSVAQARDAAQTAVDARDTAVQTINTLRDNAVADVNEAADKRVDEINAMGVNGTVRFDEAQRLTDAQMTQARANVGAASAAEVDKLSDENANLKGDLGELSERQQLYKGVVLLNNYDTTIGGVEIRINNNHVELNGVATKNIALTITSTTHIFDENQEYIISLQNVTGNMTETSIFYVVYSSGYDILTTIKNYEKNRVFTLSSNYSETHYIRLYIATNAAFENFSLDFMVEKGNVLNEFSPPCFTFKDTPFLYKTDEINGGNLTDNSVSYDKLSVEVQSHINKIIYDLLKGYSDNPYCIGDSLTYGLTNENGGGYSNYFSYPYFLGKKLGVDVSKLALSGYTASDMWNNKQSVIEGINNQLVFLWLGTNGGLTNTLETDCDGDDITAYANTHTGNYAKIVKTLVDNGNRVMLIQVFKANSGDVTITNTTINNIANKFDCKVIEIDVNDFKDLKWHTNHDGYSNSTHFSAVGYSFVADYIYTKCNILLNENPEWFNLKKTQ